MAAIIGLFKDLATTNSVIFKYLLPFVAVSSFAGATIKAAVNKPIRGYFKIRLPPFSSLLLIAFLTLFIFHLLFQALWLPVRGWDALNFWAPNAVRFLNGNWLPLDVTEGQNSHRHPMTLSYLLTWFAMSGTDASSKINPTSTWILIWLSAGLVSYGFSRRVGNSPNWSLLIALLLMTIPLAEHHALLPGYAEMLVSTSLIITVSLAMLAVLDGDIRTLAVAFIFSLMPLGFKNTGLFYTVIPIYSFFFIPLFQSFLVQRIKAKASLNWALNPYRIFTFSAVVLSYGAFFYFRHGYLEIAGHQLQITWPVPILDIAMNTFYSWIINSSFGVLGVVIILSFFFPRPSLSEDYPCYAAMTYVRMVATFGIVGLLFSQLTDHGFIYATPSNDTGNSRFTLPVACVAVQLLTLQIKLLKTPWS